MVNVEMHLKQKFMVLMNTEIATNLLVRLDSPIFHASANFKGIDVKRLLIRVYQNIMTTDIVLRVEGTLGNVCVIRT